MSTIAAISTANGNSGIGIIRLSGENCFKIIEKIFYPKSKNTEIKGYTIKYGNIVNPKNNQIIDEVLVSYFIAPKSYTTENMCEINSHGGNIVVRQILEICLENGAVLAEPGEFTKRAFLNGRIDLSQAEAVIDVINSKTELELSTSEKQLEGYLSKKIDEINKIGISLMSDIEASIDYPEYDVEEVTRQKLDNELTQIREKLNKLSNSFESGKILKDGIKTAIIGKPNAGKSSLLNAILKEERAIVTEYEGTTRDTIEEYVNVKGIPLKIIDTAGIRETNDEIEKIGIEKSKRILNESDLIIAIFDGSKSLTSEDMEILNLIKNKNAIIVINKEDLGEPNKEVIEKLNIGKPTIKISAIQNKGIEDIYETIIKLFEMDKIKQNDSFVITNVRHKQAIEKAKKYTEQAIKTINDKMPIDIVAVEIKNILDELGNITGTNVTEDIIKDIFSKFCLGK